MIRSNVKKRLILAGWTLVGLALTAHVISGNWNCVLFITSCIGLVAIAGAFSSLLD